MDVKVVPRGRTKWFQYTAIDDCTRVRVLRLYRRQNHRSSLAFLRELTEPFPFQIRRIQVDNRLEQSLLVHLPGDNAAGPIRAVAERTRDLIGVVARSAALVSIDRAEPQVDIASLSTRLELGITREVLWLANVVKRGLERGDYLGLPEPVCPGWKLSIASTMADS